MSVSTRKQKSLVVGALLGLVFPGIGLFYAAPWVVAGGLTVVALIVWKLLGWIPLLGNVIVGLMALSSGALGALYARQFNQRGRRAELSELSVPRFRG
jgi:hypothetical protein